MRYMMMNIIKTIKTIVSIVITLVCFLFGSIPMYAAEPTKEQLTLASENLSKVTADMVSLVSQLSTMLDKIKSLEHWVDYEEGEPDGYIDDKFENGNIVETTEVELDGTVTLKEFCKYEFDTKGNWIQKIIDINGKYYVVERNIEYF